MRTPVVSDVALARRAADGDEAAFEQLIAGRLPMVRRIAGHYLGQDTTMDDLVQVVLLKLWRETQAGRFNPARANFDAYVSVIAMQALRDDWQRRRAARRWAPESPLTLDMDHEHDDRDDSDLLVAPSWWQGGADPVVVVIHRERLRVAWEAISEGRRRALNAWLAADGGSVSASASDHRSQIATHSVANRPSGLTRHEVAYASDARARGRAALAAYDADTVAALTGGDTADVLDVHGF